MARTASINCCLSGCSILILIEFLFLGVKTEFVSPYSIKELNYEDAKNLIFLDFSNSIGADFNFEIYDGVKGREKIAWRIKRTIKR